MVFIIHVESCVIKNKLSICQKPVKPFFFKENKLIVRTD